MKTPLLPSHRVLTVEQFCEAHQITKVLFYAIKKVGVGPRIMKVGRRTLITLEAAAEWRSRMEENAAVSPPKRERTFHPALEQWQEHLGPVKREQENRA